MINYDATKVENAKKNKIKEQKKGKKIQGN